MHKLNVNFNKVIAKSAQAEAAREEQREGRVERGGGGERNVSAVDILPKKLNFYESVEAKAD